MSNQLFKSFTESKFNKDIVKELEEYIKSHPNQQGYVITSPLGEKYNYPYEDNVLVILIPKHKLIFLNVGDDEEGFDYYCDDFIEDLNSISDKFKYKDHIGRPRDWKKNNTIRIDKSEIGTISDMLDDNFLREPQLQRISDLLISLLIGSINDIDKKGALQRKR